MSFKSIPTCGMLCLNVQKRFQKKNAKWTGENWPDVFKDVFYYIKKNKSILPVYKV